MSDKKPTYNLKAVMRETGLNAETLRAWERRYGLLKPQRSPGGHRLYSQYEIQMLKWLVARQKEGLSISRAVEMWRSLQEEGENPLQTAVQSPTLLIPQNAALEELRRAWIEACMKFDEQTAEQLITQAFAIASPEAVCVEILQKGLSDIGQAWYNGSSSVQQEHFASALAIRRLNALITAAPPPTRLGQILAACPPGEEHEFALLMISFLLRRHGWNVVYLGANVPLVRLESTLKATSPQIIVSVSQTLPSAANLRGLSLYVEQLGTPLAYGGGVFIQFPSLTQAIAGHFLGKELAVAPQMLEKLLSTRPVISPAKVIPDEYQQALEQYQNKRTAIEIILFDFLKGDDLSPVQIEHANALYSQYLSAALSLGDIDLMGGTMNWLTGLLANYGLSPQLADEYIAAYHQAIQKIIGNEVFSVLNWH